MISSLQHHANVLFLHTQFGFLYLFLNYNQSKNAIIKIIVLPNTFENKIPKGTRKICTNEDVFGFSFRSCGDWGIPYYMFGM